MPLVRDIVNMIPKNQALTRKTASLSLSSMAPAALKVSCHVTPSQYVSFEFQSILDFPINFIRIQMIGRRVIRSESSVR